MGIMGEGDSVGMNKLARVVTVVVAASVGIASFAEAQPSEHRFFVSLDGGFQTGSEQLQLSTITPDVYGEDQVTDTSYDIDRSAGVLRANVAARLSNALGVGFGFTRSVSGGTADVNVTVPHPLFVGRPRMAATNLPALGHRENMYHFQAVWIVPLDDRVQLKLFGGPSIMKVDQAFVTGVTAVDLPPFTLQSLAQVTLADVAVEEINETGAGFNVGLDFSYMVGENYGIGGFIQYAGGSIDFPTGTDVTSVAVGGFQFGAGLRFGL
jgi:hypothetical protein